MQAITLFMLHIINTNRIVFQECVMNGISPFISTLENIHAVQIHCLFELLIKVTSQNLSFVLLSVRLHLVNYLPTFSRSLTRQNI